MERTYSTKGEHVECSRGDGLPRLRGACSPITTAAVPRRSAADPVAREFGKAVRATRKEHGETLEQVAHRIPRMDAKYLGEIERGWHAPSIATAKRIADALDVTLSHLTKGL